MNDSTSIEHAAKPRFEVRFARHPDEIAETQRLRHLIFAGELGARIDGDLDADRFDPHCRHLIVVDTALCKLAACTRLLTDDRALDAGGFYSEGEFQLDLLHALPGRVLEIGRTCVDPAYRSGAVIALLWSGLADFVIREGFDYLFGCASIGLDDGGANAHAVLTELRSRHLAPPWHRVQPRIPLPRSDAPPAAKPKLPPLIKAYVSLGAKACGEAYWDREFNCADVFMLLNVGELCPRYARRFMGQGRGQAPETRVATLV
jgi:putative hemolysin